MPSLHAAQSTRYCRKPEKSLTKKESLVACDRESKLKKSIALPASLPRVLT